MNIAREVLMNVNTSSKPAKHLRVKGNGKPGQKFSLERLEQLCQEYGVDPAKVAIAGLDPVKSPDLKEKERIDVALRLMEYTYAKRKAVEMTGKEGGDIIHKVRIEYVGNRS